MVIRGIIFGLSFTAAGAALVLVILESGAL
jgi:hypothetical protein